MTRFAISRGRIKRTLMRQIIRLIDRIQNKDRTPIFEQEWDLLIVLDGCRADGLEAVSSEYSFLPNTVPTIRSLGSWTKSWMDRNFTSEYQEEMRQTAFVTWNPHSDQLDESDWYTLDHVWKRYPEVEFLPPRVITDRGIDIWRDRNPKRLILHYKQPHAPYVSLERTQDSEEIVFDLLRNREISIDEAWDHYLENIRVVLDDIDLLRENIAAENAVLTADHGEAFGEWHLFGHGESMPIDSVMEVPWVRIETRDTEAYEPSAESANQIEDIGERSRAEQLRALGYK